MSKLSKSFKGQISRETEKAIEITVIKGDELFSTWIPKSALNMKEMPVDCLSKEGVQIFHVHQWIIDKKAKEKKTETEFIKETEKIERESISVDEVEEALKTGKFTVVTMPQPPTPDRIEFPFFPNMSVLELRDYHSKEPLGAIRGHIENLISDKRLLDVVIDILGRETDIITAIIELKEMMKELVKK